jgi:hypothetical protein
MMWLLAATSILTSIATLTITILIIRKPSDRACLSPLR